MTATTDYQYRHKSEGRVVNGKTWPEWQKWWLDGLAARNIKLTNERECWERVQAWPDYAKNALSV